MAKLTQKTADKVRCAGYHSGNHHLTLDQGYAQCDGCGTWYTEDQITEALETDSPRELGQGGVTRV